MIVLTTILDGLFLPVKILFQPGSFIKLISDFAPELQSNYSLWTARYKLLTSNFRVKLFAFACKIVVFYIFALCFAYKLCNAGDSTLFKNFIAMSAAGLAFGITVSTLFCLYQGILFMVGASVAALILNAPLISVLADKLPFSSNYKIGYFLGMLLILDYMSISVRLTITVCGLYVLRYFDICFDAIMVYFPNNFRNFILELFIGCAVIVFLHELIINLANCLIYFLTPITDTRIVLLWRISPLNWYQYSNKVPRLNLFLSKLYNYDPNAGKSAISKAIECDLNRNIAVDFLRNLLRKEALRMTSLSAIASFERTFEWCNIYLEDSNDRLPGQLKRNLLWFKEISQIIYLAEHSNTISDKIKQLRLAKQKIQSYNIIVQNNSLILTIWYLVVVNNLNAACNDLLAQNTLRKVYYNDGTPISPDDWSEGESPFKGRTDIVQEIESALTSQKSATLLLIGNRRSGKSSLLLQLPQKLGSFVLPIFIDCQSPKIISSNSASGVLVGLAEEITEQSRHNIEKLGLDPVIYPNINQDFFNTDPYPAFGRWLDIVGLALGERQLLLCFDEFEKLEESFITGRIDERFLSLLRNIMQHNRRISILLSGNHQLDELSPRWIDTLISTQLIKISFLSESDARELIVAPVKGFPNIYEPAAVDCILFLTHSQPYLVNLICGLLVEKKNNERFELPNIIVTVADVQAVIKASLDRGEAYFNDLWRSQTGGDLARRILEKLAFSESNIATSVEIIALTSDHEMLRTTIHTLLRREIIEQTVEGYRITVPLVGYYVRYKCKPI